MTYQRIRDSYFSNWNIKVLRTCYLLTLCRTSKLLLLSLNRRFEGKAAFKKYRG